MPAAADKVEVIGNLLGYTLMIGYIRARVILPIVPLEGSDVPAGPMVWAWIAPQVSR